MKRNGGALWVALAALTLVVQDEPEGLRAGVVDVRRLINEQAAYQKAQEEVDAWRAEKQKELDQAVETFQLAKAELDTLKPDSDAARQKGKELALQEARLKIERDALNDELERRRTRALREAYERVLEATERVRAEQELDLVLQYNPLPIAALGAEEVARDIVLRPVLAHAAALDITQDVLGILGVP